MIVIALILAFPIYEESKVIASRWMGMFGHAFHVETPVLSTLTVWFDRLWGSAHSSVVPLFHNTPWKFGTTVIGATAWMLALLLLMRGIRR